jgi:hypothetical protein
MDKASIIAAATAEVERPFFGVTKQFLEVHAVAREKGQPKVAGISLADDQVAAIVYFAIEDERFYFAVKVSLATFEVLVPWIEDWHQLSFHATSEILNVPQLSALTSLKPTHILNKGDNRGNAIRKWPYHSIEFEPNPKPGPFEEKLEKLLTFLEQDATGTRLLVDKAGGYIRVISELYNGNRSLGSIHLDKDSVRRMAALNLAVDFDLYAEGNFYRS